jgi:hypothetical protein
MKTKLFTVNGQRRTANGFFPLSFFRSPFSVILFIALAIAGCEEKQADDILGSQPTLLVEPANISATAAGGSHTFAVAARTVWSAPRGAR